ncbi:hypothetical protein RHGRI_017004 [Rhododendron griersonianum]|uniref:Gag-protease polyprotein n=1 Tax=Rhododendron griersonianum TaxID=479676 RepID=A0AAV6JW72_9ERIC|nr:hypothetical protein RHGRI_017004 [Rhododendron griersonianum]
MLVSEYDRIFTDLSRFAPHMVDTDAHKAKRFEEGLKDGLHEPIKLLRLQTHADILNVALLSEEDQAKSKAMEEGQKRQTTFVPARNQGGGGSFKRQNTGTSGWSQVEIVVALDHVLNVEERIEVSATGIRGHALGVGK